MKLYKNFNNETLFIKKRGNLNCLPCTKTHFIENFTTLLVTIFFLILFLETVTLTGLATNQITN